MLNTNQISNYVDKAIGELHNISVSLKRIAAALEAQNAQEKEKKDS